jgi:hypothetical protein
MAKSALTTPKKQYSVAALARKHRLIAADARAVLQQAGNSRELADRLAEAEKRR